MAERPDGPVLSNPRSDRIRALRALHGRSVRSRAGRFLIEGPQAVREAARAGAIDEMYLTDSAFERYGEIYALTRKENVRVQIADEKVIETISDSAQGIIAVGPTWVTDLNEIAQRKPSLVAELAENQDPGNAGTIIRTADAAGADAVILTLSSVDVFNPKVVSATVGSLFHVPVVTGVTLDEAVNGLRDTGVQIMAADGSGDHDLDALQDLAVARRLGAKGALDESDVDLELPTAWVFGNEARGLAGIDPSIFDYVVAAPIHGHAESLNLATAAALCLYASARAQRSSTRAKPRA